MTTRKDETLAREAYPGGDKGLRHMLSVLRTHDVRTAMEVLRGIQEAAFRAGREDGLLSAALEAAKED